MIAWTMLRFMEHLADACASAVAGAERGVLFAIPGEEMEIKSPFGASIMVSKTRPLVCFVAEEDW